MLEKWGCTAAWDRCARVAGSLLILVGVAIPALAAKKELTQLERELQGWLKSHPVSPKIPVALKGGRDQGLLVPNLFLRIDVSPSGEVSHIGRMITGQAVEVSRWNLLDPRSTPRIQFLGFDVEDAEVNFKLSVGGSVGWTGVHVHFPRGSKPRSEDLISGLAEVVDFGADFDRLEDLRRAYDSLEGRIEGLDAEVAAAGSARGRLFAFERLVPLLREAVDNRRARDGLLNVSGNEGTELAARLAELESSVHPLRREVLAELDAEWRTLRERLLLAERAFRVRPLELNQQLEAARELAEISRAAQENRSEASLHSSGRNELAVLQVFTKSLETWRADAERAQRRGCPWADPLSEAKILSLLEIPAPDLAIAGEVRRCGVSFRPEGEVLARFEIGGLGPASREAFREKDSLRFDRSQVPGLEMALAVSEPPDANAGTHTVDPVEPTASEGGGVQSVQRGASGSSTLGGLPPGRTQADQESQRAGGDARNVQRGSARGPESGRVHLRVDPSDASVYLDGRFLGTGDEVSRLRAGLLVDSGTRRFEFVRPGYLSQLMGLDVSPGEELTLRIDLRRN